MDYKRIERIASQLARRLGFSHIAEDLGRDTLLSFIENPDKKQSIRQALVDQIRKQYGYIFRKDTVVYEDVHESHHIGQELWAEIFLYYSERPVMGLRDLYGYNNKEIAFMLGVSETRASQIYYAEKTGRISKKNRMRYLQEISCRLRSH